MTRLEQYYNKFNEEHRLKTRHGIVEFEVSMFHIKKAIEKIARVGNNANFADSTKQANFAIPPLKILDVGAGTGRYSVELCHLGYEVTAVEPVKRNLEVLRSKHEKIKTWQGNALNLSFLDENKFDVVLCFGPMYHLHTKEERLLALEQIKRVTKSGGIIFVAYILNEYAILKYCFGENKISEVLENGGLTKDFHCVTSKDDLYSYLRIEDINAIQKESGLKRIKMFSQEGAADFMRQTLNQMDEKTFRLFVDYTISISERPELLGAGTHLVDVLQKL